MTHTDLNMDNQWLPFTPNRTFRQDPRVFVGAEGMHFTTHDGKKVIDGISSLWCVGAGHNRKPINEAIKKQLDTLDYATAFQASNDKAFKAAQMIADMAPGDLNKVLFCNSGSEAADTALKIAIAFHRATRERQRAVAATVFQGRKLPVARAEQHHLVVQEGACDGFVGELRREPRHVPLIEWKRMGVGDTFDAVDGNTLAGHGSLLRGKAVVGGFKDRAQAAAISNGNNRA